VSSPSPDESKFKVLDALLRPKSIAVVGASATPGKLGAVVLANILSNGYTGKVFPVNPTHPEIQGLKAYPSVLDVPGEIDAAVLAVPAALCGQVAEECGRKGVKGLIVIASGFREIGRADLEEELVRIAARYGTRILGPNIVGIMSNSDKLNASFSPFLPYPGRSSLVSQSGALIVAVEAATHIRRVGFDKMISIGNMSDVDIVDCVEWLDADSHTTCIALYIEGLKNGRRFVAAARRARKPIVVLKSGVSALGGAAAASHTGSLAGSAKVYEAAFSQAGVVQARDLDGLFERTLSLSLQPPMNGANLCILTNGGGVGVLATDAAERLGIPLEFAPSDLQAQLRPSMPEFASSRNPVDLSGMAGSGMYDKTVRTALAHPWVHGLVVLYCENSLTTPMEIAQSIYRSIQDSGVHGKPVTIAFIGGERSADCLKWFMEKGVPAFETPDKAVNAMAALREYAKIRSLATEILPEAGGESPGQARKVIAAARARGRNTLTEVEAKEVFSAYGLPVTTTVLAETEDAAVKAAGKIGYPVVLKIVSPDILHKSDAGGVKINVKDDEAVRAAYRAILAAAKAYKADADIQGIAVQQMAPLGTEVILGSVNDPSFGPTVMFGLGGIFVEILKDVTFRVAPVSSTQAERMLAEIEGAPLLAGARGEAPRDRDALVQVIIAYSRMILDLEDDIAESDANPIFVYEKGQGLKVADARIILKKK
jgi:acetyl coenzyme A synthetase (ADP forming)-like protein